MTRALLDGQSWTTLAARTGRAGFRAELGGATRALMGELDQHD